MIIVGVQPYSMFIHGFVDGVEVQSCFMIDTTNGTAIAYDGIDTTNQCGSHRVKELTGKVTFKIDRGANIPDPYFTELTNDSGFAGFTE